MLNGQVAIITGGTQGIGRGIAERFAQAGAEVIVCARKAPAQALPFHFVQADVREPEQIEDVITYARRELGRLDVLVNNAGGSPPADAATASPRFSTAIIHLNLLAPLHFARAAHAVMREQAAGGTIINVASVSGLRPSPGTAAYGAAKAGLLHLTQSLAVEWAPHVRVNAVTPGLVRTEQAALHYGDEAAQARVHATVPFGRMAEPADVGDACLYFASPLASYVTGANLVVHGGGERPAFLAAAAPAGGAAATHGGRSA